jgi:hypothetical protein
MARVGAADDLEQVPLVLLIELLGDERAWAS